MKGTSCANNGTYNAVKGTDNANKGTDNAVKGTDNANNGAGRTDCRFPSADTSAETGFSPTDSADGSFVTLFLGGLIPGIIMPGLNPTPPTCAPPHGIADCVLN